MGKTAVSGQATRAGAAVSKEDGGEKVADIGRIEQLTRELSFLEPSPWRTCPTAVANKLALLEEHLAALESRINGHEEILRALSVCVLARDSEVTALIEKAEKKAKEAKDADQNP